MIATLASRLRDRSAADLARLVARNLAHAVRGQMPAARARRRADGAFDRRWGTDTRSGVSVHDLGFDAGRIDHCRRYDPSDETMLRDPVGLLGLDPRDWHFVDYGAGKGRMAMLAMEMGFAEATGVELSARLCATARANIARFAARHPGMTPARIVAGDAAAFRPTAPAILAYFYNPFDAVILAEVRERLEEALAAGTDRVLVIYANPEHGAVFAAAPAWHAHRAPPGIAIFSAGRPVDGCVP